MRPKCRLSAKAELVTQRYMFTKT